MRRNRLFENRLRGMVRRAVTSVLREGSQQMRYNDEGEPIGYEYVPDQYEQEEMEWEENMRRHEDPSYAASQEAEAWYQKACRAFEEQGVEVPEDVKYALARELRRKRRKQQEADAMKVLEPLVSALEEMGYETRTYYEPETAQEYENYGIDVTKNGQSLSNEELRQLQDTLGNAGYYGAWDYVHTW